MGSFTDFIRGERGPGRNPDSRGCEIHTTFLWEGFDGYEKVGILKGASTYGPTITEHDTIESVLETVAAAFRIPKAEVPRTTSIIILLSPKSIDGEVFAKRKEPRTHKKRA